MGGPVCGKPRHNAEGFADLRAEADTADVRDVIVCVGQEFRISPSSLINPLRQQSR